MTSKKTLPQKEDIIEVCDNAFEKRVSPEIQAKPDTLNMVPRTV